MANRAEAEAVSRTLAEHRSRFVVRASGFELPNRYFRVDFAGPPNRQREGRT